MFLPTEGFNRDRTADFNNMKESDKGVFVDRNTSDSLYLISHETPKESVFEPFFQLSRDIQTELQSMQVTYSSLLKAQNECLRPTFTDERVQLTTVNSLTNTITSQLKEVHRRINFVDAPKVPKDDRAKIIKNIKTNLQEQYNEFNTKFKMSLHAFSTSYNESNNTKKAMTTNDDEAQTIDYSSFNFGENAEILEQERQTQQNIAQIEELTRRAEQIRDIFVDLQNLVSEQGTIVDRIDCNISTSLENAKVAHEQIEKAAEYQKKSRMWVCVVVLAVFVLILIVMIILK